MAYRDLLFGPLRSVFVVDGLRSELVEALPDALVAVLHARSSARRRWDGSASRGPVRTTGQLTQLAADSVHRASGRPGVAALTELAHGNGVVGLPVALTITDDQCAVVVAHRAFDGTGSLQLVHDLLDAAAGLPLAPEESPARLPVLQALLRVRSDDVRRFVEARRGRPASPPASASSMPPRATSAAFSLSPTDLAGVRRYREPNRAGRATLHSRIASLIVASLREVATSDVDIPVWMTSDVRHLAEGRVDGNFITRELVGTLHGDQWAPGALAARMMRLKEPGQALALVWGPTGWLLRSALGKKPTAGEEIVLTLATTQRAFPTPVRSVTATSIGGSPTFGFAWQTKDSVYVSVYNSSGAFDLDRFEEVFRRIVRERAGG